MTSRKQETFPSIMRQPHQTDEEWQAELSELLKKVAASRPAKPAKIYPATSQSWKNNPIGAAERIPYSDRFSGEEIQKIKRGLIPGQMEDKWFIYFEDGYLHLHRSWTGNAIYRVRIEEDGDGGQVIAAECSAEYLSNSNARYEAALLRFLIGNLILRRGYPFPMPDNTKEPVSGVFQHVMSGTGYPEKPYKDE